MDDVPAGDEARLWLYGVARRVLANHRRGETRRGALADRLRAELTVWAGSHADQDRGAIRSAFQRLARELFEEIATAPIMTTEPTPGVLERYRHLPGRRSLPEPMRRRWITVPLAAGFAATALAVSWVLPGTLGLGPRQAAAFDITQEDGDYVIKVETLFADPEHYEAQLRDLGLNISVRLRPVSPSLEGSIITGSDDIETTQRAGVCGEWLRCPIELKVPVGYRGKASILLGRKARPGEAYEGMGKIEMPREPLHCVDFVNKSVDQVGAMLKERGVTIKQFAYKGKGMRSRVPGWWYVHEGVLSEPGKAILLVSPVRDHEPVPLTAFCPNGSRSR
jgi:hypothetical protein